MRDNKKEGEGRSRQRRSSLMDASAIVERDNDRGPPLDAGHAGEIDDHHLTGFQQGCLPPGYSVAMSMMHLKSGRPKRAPIMHTGFFGFDDARPFPSRAGKRELFFP